jgi:hypothetical protein
MMAELRAECDIVVTGVGDCGSCSASAVADGLLLEQSGIPAVVICSDAFTVSADAMASLRGAAGYRYVTTSHPVANLTPDGVRARAAQAVPAIVARPAERLPVPHPLPEGGGTLRGRGAATARAR